MPSFSLCYIKRKQKLGDKSCSGKSGISTFQCLLIGMPRVPPKLATSPQIEHRRANPGWGIGHNRDHLKSNTIVEILFDCEPFQQRLEHSFGLSCSDMSDAGMPLGPA